MPVAQHPGKLERLDLQMVALGAALAIPGHIELLEDVEPDQGREARTVGRDFEKLDAGEGGRDRLDQGRGGLGEIIEGKKAAALLETASRKR